MWALWVGLLMLTSSVVTGLPIMTSWTATRFLIQHLLTLGALAAFEYFYLLSVYRGRRRPALTKWLRGIMYGFGAVMVLACVLSVVFEHPDFAALDYRAFPLARVMVLAFTAATGTSLLSLAWLSWRWSRIADRTWVRRSLVTFTIGTIIGLSYAVHHFVFTILFTSGITPPYPQVYEVPLIVLGVFVLLVGLSMPAWGPAVSAVRRWVRHARSYRKLGPVHAAFAESRPEIRLGRNGPMWDMEFALYRRVIEIWDGRSRLCAYLDPDLARTAIEAGKARGLAGAQLAAAVEADLWRDALRASAKHGTPRAREIPDEPETGDNLADAVRFLELIASAWRRPPLVEMSAK
jgi:hypothetical protein